MCTYVPTYDLPVTLRKLLFRNDYVLWGNDKNDDLRPRSVLQRRARSGSEPNELFVIKLKQDDTIGEQWHSDTAVGAR